LSGVAQPRICHAVLTRRGALEVADQEGDQVGGHFGRGEELEGVLAFAGAGRVTDAMGPFEMAVSPASMISEMS
jgi:hypothetical protein